jgi:ATP-binding cassette subfamily C protein LapB
MSYRSEPDYTQNGALAAKLAIAPPPIPLAVGPGLFEQMLLEILTAVGWRGEQRRLVEALPHLEPIASFTMLRAVLANLDVNLIQVARRVGELSMRDFPCLVVKGEESCQLVTGKGEDTPRVYDLTTRFDGPALGALRGTFYLIRTDKVREPLEQPKPEAFVRHVLRMLKRHILGVAGYSALISALGIVLSLYILVVYDLVIATGSLDTLAFLAIGALIGLTLEMRLYVLRAKAIGYIAARFDGIVSIRSFSSVLGLPLALTERAPLSSQLARFRQFEIGRELFAGNLASGLLDLPFTLLFIGMLFIIGGSLGFLPIGIAITIMVIATLSAPITISQISKVGTSKLKSDAMLLELMGKLGSIRSASAETRWLARYSDALAAYERARFDNARISSTLQIVTSALVAFAGIATLGLGAVRVMDGSMTLGALVASMMIVWRILSPVQIVSLNLPRLKQIRATLRQINDLVRMRAERDDAMPVVFRQLDGGITAAGVYLSMGVQQEPQLRGIQLDIKAGEVIAITGPSGSGKSTLLKVLLGLYPQYMGTIRLGGLDMRQLDPSEIRAAIGYAPQQQTYFYGSVAGNIRLAFPEASDAEVIEALASVGIHLPNPELPDGLETRISGTGSRLFSQGMLCRLSLARAFVKKSSILLLDDPSKGLDRGGDEALIAHINAVRGDTTVLLVTARPSHMRAADRVIVMNAGTIVASGKPDTIVPEIMQRIASSAA